MCIFMFRIAGRQFPVGQPPHLNSTVSIFWIFIPGRQVKYYHSKNLTSQLLSDIFCKQKTPSWLYGDFGCQLYAAVGFYFGIGVIFSLGLIILDSYVITFSKMRFLKMINIKNFPPFLKRTHNFLFRVDRAPQTFLPGSHSKI